MNVNCLTSFQIYNFAYDYILYFSVHKHLDTFLDLKKKISSEPNQVDSTFVLEKYGRFIALFVIIVDKLC